VLACSSYTYAEATWSGTTIAGRPKRIPPKLQCMAEGFSANSLITASLGTFSGTTPPFFPAKHVRAVMSAALFIAEVHSLNKTELERFRLVDPPASVVRSKAADGGPVKSGRRRSGQKRPTDVDGCGPGLDSFDPTSLNPASLFSFSSSVIQFGFASAHNSKASESNTRGVV
jgi:hypothetical protein